jgi:3-keto-disaccharide hydrolase
MRMSLLCHLDWRSLLLSAISCLVGASPAWAEESFVSLFDGQTLNGWHKNPQRIGHGTGGEWTVEDGAITGQQDPPGSGNGGILLSDKKFGDFELLIDLKPDWGVCSGLFLRSTDQGQCLQMMVDYHEAGDVGHVYGEGKGVGGFNTRPFDIFGVYQDKSLVALTTKPNVTKGNVSTSISCSPEEWLKAWKVNDWNTARVRVVGNPAVMTTWINGVKICEFDGNTYEAKNYDKTKVSDTLGSEGHIAVQVHGGKSWPLGAKCRWKNILVKPL